MKVIVMKKRTLIACLAPILTIVLIGVIVGTALGASEQAFGKSRRVPIYSVETAEKKIAISFDCAWGTEYTDKLLEIMEEKGVKSTFFSVEFWTKKNAEYIKKIDAAGHEIGTHSATHPYMSKLDAAAIKRELDTSKAAITNITGKEVKLFRPPYGDYDDELIETAESVGLYTIQWDVDSLDWKNLTAREIYDRVVPRVRNGSIVLFHNNGLHTAEALPMIIDALHNEGYEFVGIYDLIYKDNYIIDRSGRQINTANTNMEENKK